MEIIKMPTSWVVMVIGGVNVPDNCHNCNYYYDGLRQGHDDPFKISGSCRLPSQECPLPMLKLAIAACTALSRSRRHAFPHVSSFKMQETLQEIS